MKYLLLCIVAAILFVGCGETPAKIQANDTFVDEAAPEDQTNDTVTTRNQVQVDEKANVQQTNPEVSVEEAVAQDQDTAVPSEILTDHDNPPPSVQIIGGDEAALREFMERWFIPFDPERMPDPVIISIGSLQEGMPVILPMPDDARLLATVTGQWADYALVLDTALPPNEVQTFYEQSLLADGWQLPERIGMDTGFVSQPTPKGYCFDDGNIFLSINASLVADGMTDLRLDLYTEPDAYMCQDGDVMGYTPKHFSLIPSLTSLAGVQLSESGTGGSDSSAETRSQLRTELSAAELAADYNNQLEAAGWQALAQEEGGGAAWSTWSLTDEDGEIWSGMLFIVESSVESNGRYAFVRIERDS